MASRPRASARTLLVVLTSVAALAALACSPAPPPDPVNGVTSTVEPASSEIGGATQPVIVDDGHAGLVDGAPSHGEEPPALLPDDEPAGEPDPPTVEDAVVELPEGEAPGGQLPEVEAPQGEEFGAELPEPDAPELDDGSHSDEQPTEPVPQPFVPTEPTAVANEPTIASQAQPGERVVLDVGHVDLIEVTRDGERLVISVKDDTDSSGAVFRRPSDIQSRVRDGARTQIPVGGAFDFLGAAGSDIWLLPQVQDAQLLWPGWSTERLGAGQVEGNAVTMRLRSVDGPGRVDLFTTDQFGSPNRLFGPGTPDEFRVPINTHAHANWAFSAPGQYRLTFEVSATIAGGAATSTQAEYVFLVGDDTPVVPWDSIADPGPGGGTGGGGSGDTPGGPGSPDDPGAVSPGGDAVGAGNGAGSAGGGVAGNGASGRGGAGSGGSGSGGAGSLARTGGDAGAVLLAGLVLITLGVASVGVGRRRRNRPAVLGRT